MKIFRRAATAKAVLQIDFEPADAANALDSGELQFTFAERPRDALAIGDVAKRNADAIAEGKGAHLMIAIGAQGGIALELLSRALRHHLPVTTLELRADDVRRDLPEDPANNVAPR